MKATVIHHSADFDGIFCREIAKRFLPGADLIGWDYKDPKLPFPAEGQVYVLDLSPECFESLPDINEVGRRLVWIDHHKTAIAKWPESIPGYRIDGVAACRLAWQWFTMVDGNTRRLGAEIGIPIRPAGVLPMIQDYKHREVNEPLAVRLAGEYDIWDKRDPRAELFQHGLRSQDLTDVWLKLLDGSQTGEIVVLGLLACGESLQYAQQRQNESIIKELGFTFQWEGLRFLAYNAARYNSLLFTAGLKPEHDGCFGFKWTGRDFSVSLYGVPGKPDVDLSAIAMKYGGGGHKQACGFRTAWLPFLPWPSPDSKKDAVQTLG